MKPNPSLLDIYTSHIERLALASLRRESRWLFFKFLYCKILNSNNNPNLFELYIDRSFVHTVQVNYLFTMLQLLNWSTELMLLHLLLIKSQKTECKWKYLVFHLRRRRVTNTKECGVESIASRDPGFWNFTIRKSI